MTDPTDKNINAVDSGTKPTSTELLNNNPNTTNTKPVSKDIDSIKTEQVSKDQELTNDDSVNNEPSIKDTDLINKAQDSTETGLVRETQDSTKTESTNNDVNTTKAELVNKSQDSIKTESVNNNSGPKSTKSIINKPKTGPITVPNLNALAKTDKDVDVDHDQFEYIMKICLLYGKIMQESNATNEMIQANIHKVMHHLHLDKDELSTYNATTSFIIINRHDNTVKMIPVAGSSYNFEKLVRSDKLLNKFLANEVTTDEFDKQLHMIDSHDFAYSEWNQIISAAFVCGGMSVIINGMSSGFLLTMIVGFISYWFFLKVQDFVGLKIFSVLSYSTFTCLLIVALYKLHLVAEPYSILFSCIMPVLPGTTFVNSIKAIMDGNYISGLIETIDALNTALMLGLPAAIVFTSLL